MNYETPLSSFDSEIVSMVKKNHHATFEKYINMRCYSLKTDEGALFKNISKIPTFVIRPLNPMLNFEEDILSLQQLEYEMYCTDYPADYNFFNHWCLV